jgi:predicted Holliday junction resolvase-like endonuclease
MNDARFAKEIIRILEDGGFYAECPCCEEPILLRDCDLFYLDDFSEKGQEIYDLYREELKQRRTDLRERRKDISASSEIQARAANIGFILERLAPSLSTFRFECSDCRSLFDPIDYIIFEGLAEKGSVSRIIFADIKTGNAALSGKQREIRNLVNTKKVEFDTYEAKT